MIERTVRVIGNVELGDNVSIAGPTEIMGKHSEIKIGSGCDIAAFVTISTADSHKRCIGIADDIERKPIVIGDNVFIGQGAIILGGCVIGDNSVIGAGVVLKGVHVPPWSRVTAPQPEIQAGFYRIH